MKKIFYLILLFFIFSCVSKSKYDETTSNNSKEFEISKRQNDSIIAYYKAQNDELLKKIKEIQVQQQQNENSKEFYKAQSIKLMNELIRIKKEITLNTALIKLDTITSISNKQVLIIKSDTVTKYIKKQIVVTKTDTITKVIVPETLSSKIALYCPKVMNYKESSDVFGFISELLSDERVKKKMIDRIKEEGIDLPNNHLDDKNILIQTINYFNLIELKLDDADNEGFVIKNVHESSKQKVEPKMEGWHWVVTPKSDEPIQKLIFKAIIYKADGSVDLSFSRTYEIQIKVKLNRFWHKLRMLIAENPEWAISTIIIPVVAFFWGRYQERKRKLKPNPKP